MQKEAIQVLREKLERQLNEDLCGPEFEKKASLLGIKTVGKKFFIVPGNVGHPLIDISFSTRALIKVVGAKGVVFWVMRLVAYQ